MHFDRRTHRQKPMMRSKIEMLPFLMSCHFEHRGKAAGAARGGWRACDLEVVQESTNGLFSFWYQKLQRRDTTY